MNLNEIYVLQVGPSVPRDEFVAPHPFRIQAETSDGGVFLTLRPDAAAVLANELAIYVNKYAPNQLG
jgi:hypothetical protein